MEAIRKSKKEIVKMLLKQDLEERDEQELIEKLIDNPIAIDVDKLEDENMTKSDKLADLLCAKAGSWRFIIGFTSFLVLWIIFNSVILITKAFDPYPFILLNLALSCVAALQAPIIMMSQNRQAKKDSLRSHNDYLTDLKSELILEVLHDQINELNKNQRKILRILEPESTDEIKK